MKKAALHILFLVGAINLVAQQKDSVSYLRVEDPTQIFTMMDLNAGINFERYNWGIEPSFWEFNYRVTLGSDKFRTGFVLPFNNNSNEITGLADIGIDFGYKIHQSKGIYSATTLNAGVFFPTSYSGHYQWSPSFSGTPSPFFTFFGNYTSSLKLSNKLYLYPKAGYYQREHFQSGSIVFWAYDTLANGSLVGYVDSVYYPPKQSRQGWQFEIGSSYRFNHKHFISAYIGYQTGHWFFRENGSPYPGPATFQKNDLTFGVHYQYAFSQSSQMYIRIDGLVEGVNLASYKQYGYYKDSYFLRLGYRYYFGVGPQ